jgi:hypothetical protein
MHVNRLIDYIEIKLSCRWLAAITANFEHYDQIYKSDLSVIVWGITLIRSIIFEKLPSDCEAVDCNCLGWFVG